MIFEPANTLATVAKLYDKWTHYYTTIVTAPTIITAPANVVTDGLSLTWESERKQSSHFKFIVAGVL